MIDNLEHSRQQCALVACVMVARALCLAVNRGGGCSISVVSLAYGAAERISFDIVERINSDYHPAAVSGVTTE
jgi:hypothetical protein